MTTLKHPKIAGFQLYEQIGGGGFSSVYKAFNAQSKSVAACKVVSLQEDTPAHSRKMVEKEIRVHSAMKHLNVLEFFNALIVEPSANAKYFPGIYMLLELASGGDLFDKIAPDIGIQEDIAQFYFNQMIAGLTYIHGQGVCHRDLKPENLLLDIAGRLKISDFGLCSVFKHKESGKVRMLAERCGSLPYVAPELNSQDPYHAEPVDVWGTGVILFTLLVGNTPWDEPSQKSSEFVRYANGEIFADEPWCRIGTEAMSLIRGILTINPYQRFKLADITAHPWCLRPSQLPGSSSALIAQKLIESLQQNGDMNLINPQITSTADVDDDTEMISASYQSQFTQSLLLFSQTQSGRRYTPHLTRFYCSASPVVLMPLANDALIALGVKTKMGQPVTDSNGEKLRLRIGGFDRRKEMFKGWLELENFNYRGGDGSFCVMQRDQGNPISWRQLWKALANSPGLAPFVLRK